MCLIVSLCIIILCLNTLYILQIFKQYTHVYIDSKASTIGIVHFFISKVASVVTYVSIEYLMLRDFPSLCHQNRAEELLKNKILILEALTASLFHEKEKTQYCCYF